MTKINKIIPIITPFLLSTYPVIFQYNLKKYHYDFRDIYPTAIFYIGVTGLVFILFQRIYIDTRKASIFSSLFLFVFASLGQFQISLYRFLNINIFKPKYLNLTFVIFILFSVFLFILVRKGSKPDSINKIIFITGLFLFLFNLIPVLLFKIEKFPGDKRFVRQWEMERESLTRGIQPRITEKPDIYYIILDGYAREDVLKSFYSFNNGKFINKLRLLGFYVPGKSRSNYAQTFLSLASSLNMQYFDDIRDYFDKTDDYRFHLKYAIKHNKLSAILRNLGYRHVQINSNYHITENNQEADLSVENNNFFIQSSSAYDLAHLSALKLIESYFFRQTAKSFLKNIKSVGNISRDAGPTFTFYHLLLPHPPYYFDAKGKKLGPPVQFAQFKSKAKWSQKQKYTGQVKFLNGQILMLINKLLKKPGTKPIIVLQSDHGPGNFKNAWLNNPQLADGDFVHKRTGIFTAIFAPEAVKEKLYDEISPVNIFRIILSQGLGWKMNTLPDKTYYSHLYQPFDFHLRVVPEGNN